MPQFNFWASWEDSWSILRGFVEGRDVLLIPDRWYETPEAEVFRSVTEEVKNLLSNRRRLYIFSADAELRARYFERQEIGPRRGMYRFHAALGESLDLTLPACYQEGSVTRLASGILTYPGEVFDWRSEQWRKPREELRNLYTQMCAVIKSYCLRRRVGQHSIFVGQNAVRLVEARQATLRAFGLDFSSFEE
ncbi:MAG TPA: hypothetical protein PLP42_03080 [Acidobacteriota bacterium]|nr:hypothetical protein [Acidobacteriota bacterium]